MSKHTAGLDFAQWVPGFDFLQQAAQAHAQAPQAQMPWAQWLAPTLDPQEAARRIQELKTVLFWLEQNATALKATIQALEVQQLTCQTLQDMQAHWMSQAGQAVWAPTVAPESAAASAADATAAKASGAAEASAAAGAGHDAGAAPSADAWQGAAAQAGQWWGSLLHTFGQIAQQAQQEVAQRQAAFAQVQGQDLQEPNVGDVPADGTAAASAATAGTTKPQAPRRAKASASARVRSSRAEAAPRAASAQGSKRPAATTKQRANRASITASATVKPTGAKSTRSQAKAALSKAASAGTPSTTPTAAPRTTKSAARKRG